MYLYAWAARWQIPPQAIAELTLQMGLLGTPGDTEHAGKSERFADSALMLESGRKGVMLFRNNVGVLQDDTGRPVRYGLANESKQINQQFKSADRIGIRRVVITPQHVGLTIGQFVSREVKRPGWRYTGQGRELAQLNWAQLVLSYGGDAAFTTGEGSL